jgi:hypothetical protein
MGGIPYNYSISLQDEKKVREWQKKKQYLSVKNAAMKRAAGSGAAPPAGLGIPFLPKRK